MKKKRLIHRFVSDMGEFSNVPRESVRTYEYNGAAIECIPPSHKPGNTFQTLCYIMPS